MRTNKLLYAMMLLMFLMIGYNYTFAQLITSSTIREEIEIWKELDNPVFIGEGNDFYGTITMPFSFIYDGTSISTIYAYDNGFISLNKRYSADGTTLPRFPLDNMVISWYRADLFTTKNMSYQVSGTAPFRVLTVQQLGARVAAIQSTNTMDVQIKFYETTNEIKITYKNAATFGDQGINGYLYFSGNYSGANARYINIKPEDPQDASTFYYSTVNPNISAFLTREVRNFFYEGRSFTLTSVPKLSGVYPSSNDLIASGHVYTDLQHPYVRVSRSADQKNILIKYKITGPLGTANEQVIYTAINEANLSASDSVNPDPQPIGTAIRVDMPHAKGIAGRLSDGALDLRVTDNFPSGDYRVDASIMYADGTPYSHSISSIFTMTYPVDLALLNISEPIYGAGSIYPLALKGIPVQIYVKNQGADPVKQFTMTYKVYDANNNLIKTSIEQVDLNSNPLLYTEARYFTFTELIKVSSIGTYSIVSEVNFNNPSLDKNLPNNIFPRANDPKRLFEVGYIDEIAVDQMLSPSTSYKNRPIRLQARFVNNGVSSVTNVWAYAKVTDSKNTVKYLDSVLVQEVPTGFVKYVDIVFPNPFIPDSAQTYNVNFNIVLPGDEVPSNNTATYTLNIQRGMKGLYKISRNNGHYPTITRAVNDLYLKGVDGNVTFTLGDTTFTEGSLTSLSPAIDLSSRIIGIGPNATVTFTIDPVIANRGAVTIRLLSESGIGIYLGQNAMPNNNFAPIYNVTNDLAKNYSNSNGYLIFDGGAKKSLRFTIGTSNYFRSVFYLGTGAQNITIKNCIIEDGIIQPPSFDCRIPLTVYNSSFSRFDFEDDNNPSGTYTAGVVIRNKVPVNGNLYINEFNLDTIINSNNIISTNEISKFGYGVVSLGTGILYHVGSQSFTKYYNYKNKINNNLINTVSRAAVYLGFEKGTEVTGNRIWNVNGLCGSDNAGIIVGGDHRAGYFGYNNIECHISANEISNVKGSSNLYGIKVEQSNLRLFTEQQAYMFPDEDENIRLVNNIIWGFEPANVNTNIIGIGLFTERKSINSWNNLNVTPKDTNYYSRNDIISNNTIFLMNDGKTNKGVMMATAIMNTKGLELLNNAIAVDDSDFDLNNTQTAAVFYYGLHPKLNGIYSDRNAYWIRNNYAALYRFIETDIKGRVVEQGFYREFVTLDQWQQWTQQDWYSVVGDFAKDYERLGIAPFKYRVKSNPAPTGSILNNRGIATDLNKFDIDNQLRGEAGENYDIGADEFKGVNQTRDLQVMAVPKPGTYQATYPYQFSDANYIMTTSPVAVTAIVRNNGTLPYSDMGATLKIMRETSTPGIFTQEGPTIVGSITDLLSHEEVLINFRTDDGINLGNNYEFYPMTYGQLRDQNYLIPDQFKAMEANVTPLYKFVIEVPYDHDNSNNKIEKLVRFYVKKSPVYVMLSAENIPITPITSSTPLNIIAGKLNLDTLVTAFKRMGWYINLDLEDPRIDIDIFDRKQWEPRSINYNLYMSLFWIDGDDTYDGTTPSRLSRYDRDHITNFMSIGTAEHMRNLIVASQEIVRNESIDYADWVTNILYAKKKLPTSPLGDGVPYDNEYLQGFSIGRNLTYLVKATGFLGDALPYPGTFTINNPGKGHSSTGLTYKKYLGDNPLNNTFVPESERLASITTNSVLNNTILIGVDWRHFGNIDVLLDAILDNLLYNGAKFPVELVSFDATKLPNRVELTWSTASELNSDKFIVEKATMNESGQSNFETIQTVAAQGNTSSLSYYGPIVDLNVKSNTTYLYRLKMMDRDGKFEYSDVKTVTYEGGVITLDEISPNPTHHNATVKVNTPNSLDINVSVVDINGNSIMNVFSGRTINGANEYIINTSNIASGVYNIIVKSGDIVLTTKLNVVK